MGLLNAKILIIDDDIENSAILIELIKEIKHKPITAKNGLIGLELVEKTQPDLILLDIKMPKMDGIELLSILKSNDKYNDIPVVMVTYVDEIESITRCIEIGAYDYTTKPFNKNELHLRITRALESRNILLENKCLKAELQEKSRYDNIIGKSKKMQQIFHSIDKVAPTDSTILIHGETGTGKELIARAIHNKSKRNNQPYIYLDCGSLTETLLESELFGHTKGSFTGADSNKQGIFQAANKGTIFLDEIENMSLQLQSKLLRVLQEKEIKPVGSTKNIKINVRLIGATNENLEEMVQKKTFRHDLYYRLNVVPINLPPLRERNGDITLLINAFLSKYASSKKKSISNDALKQLETYSWPGNIRELENVIERMVVLSDDNLIKMKDLPQNIQGSKNSINYSIPKTNNELIAIKKSIRKEAVSNIETSFILDALERSNWNISKAADKVKMDRSNFSSLMRKYKITVSR